MRLLLKTFAPALVLAVALFAASTASAAPSVGIEGKRLLIRGGDDGESVRLSVPASAPNLVVLDLDGDGLEEFELPRRHFERVDVEMGAGEDSVSVEAPPRLRLEPIHVDGGEDLDIVTLAGSDSSEELRAAPAGTRARLSRDGDRVRLLASAVERADLPAGAGRDELAVRDLTGTELSEVHADLGDGQDDRLTVDGSPAGEQISALGFDQSMFVIGAFAFVQIENVGQDDELIVDGRAGDDLVSASSAAMSLTLRGGAGSDVLLGGPGDDALEGGDDFDDVAGRGGDDRADMGDYFDRFTWRPGDGSDIVEGGAGHDSVSFNGGDVPELLTLAADGRRVRITRDLDASVTDLGGIEEVNTVPRGGADTLRIGDLARTPVSLVHANMAAGGSTGDGAVDTVEVTGTARADSIAVSGAGRAVDVSGLPALVELTLLDPIDRLALRTGGGADSVDSSGLPAGIVDLIVD